VVLTGLGGIAKANAVGAVVAANLIAAPSGWVACR
jgi:hypothetical protein